MFGELFDTLLPAVGEFFGILAGVAMIKPSAFLLFLETVLQNPGTNPIFSVGYFNPFTGISGVNNDLVHYAFDLQGEFFGSTVFGRILTIVGSRGVSLFFGPFISLPLWVALPCAFAMWGWIISFVKWLWGIVFK